jgi:cytochrome c oxidase subunit 4
MAHHDPNHSLRIYFLVFGALLVGTLATVLVAKVDLGVMNDVVAMVIAVTKALLVILFFMHVRYSTRLTALTALAGFVWLAILLGITMSDYLALGKIIPVPGK